MTLVVPNQAQAIALTAFLNKTAPQDLVVDLYTNNVTPADTDTEATFTAAAGGGYVQKAITAANWNTSGGSPTIAVNNIMTWTFTGALTANAIVYGYFVRQAVSGKLLWAERAAAQFQPQNNGDEINLTPAISANG